jgi:hypothetical protein
MVKINLLWNFKRTVLIDLCENFSNDAEEARYWVEENECSIAYAAQMMSLSEDEVRDLLGL